MTDGKELPHLDRIGLRKLGNPGPAFAFYNWKALDDGSVLMTGGVFRLLKSGKRKGERTWVGCAPRSVAVTRAQIADEEKRFSAETGKCHRCLGTGQEFARWSCEKGTEYRECRHCKGTGKDGQS